MERILQWMSLNLPLRVSRKCHALLAVSHICPAIQLIKDKLRHIKFLRVCLSKNVLKSSSIQSSRSKEAPRSCTKWLLQAEGSGNRKLYEVKKQVIARPVPFRGWQGCVRQMPHLCGSGNSCLMCLRFQFWENQTVSQVSVWQCGVQHNQLHLGPIVLFLTLSKDPCYLFDVFQSWLQTLAYVPLNISTGISV